MNVYRKIFGLPAPVVISWVLVPLFFAIDLALPLGYAGGLLYMIPVVLAMWGNSARYIWQIASVTVLLTALGFALSFHTAPMAGTVYANRLSAMVGLGITAWIIARQITTRGSLVATESRLAEAQRAAQIGSFNYDVAGNAVWLSSEAQRLLAVDSSTVSPHDLTTRVLGGDRKNTQRLITRAFRNRKPLTATFRFERCPGEIRVIRITSNVLNDAVVGTVQDLTEQTEREHEFLQAQRLEAVGRLASGVAHDVNNVLMGVHGCLDVARSKLDANHSAQPFLVEAQQTAASGAAIMRQLLSLDRRRAEQAGPVELDSFLSQQENVLQRLVGDNVDLKLRLDAPQATVRCDPGQLHQVVLNLVVNARDAMQQGGELSIETEFLTGHPKFPATRCARLTVSDNGCGMNEETRARVFEPFFTTKAFGRGTGLGLSTTHSVVTQAGGTIEIESEPSVGTTFRVLFPVENAANVAPQRSAEAGDGSAQRVLVVEDEPLVRLTLLHYLARRGYDARAVNDAEEAIELFAQQPDGFDVLLTDIILPGSSGFELSSQLLSKEPDLRVVYMSASPDLAKRHPDTVGATILNKPFTEEELAIKLSSTPRPPRPAVSPTIPAG